VKLPSAATVKVAVFGLVIAGAVPADIVRVKLCTALGSTPLAAVKVNGYVPCVPAAGVPDKNPVAALKVTPEGRAPDSESVGAGDPVAVTVKPPALPTVDVVALALVIAGAVPTDVTVVMTVEVLLPGVGSPPPELTVAVLVSNVPTGVAPLTLTTEVKLAEPPVTNVAMVQVIVPFDPTGGLMQANAGPDVCVSDTNVVPPGRGSARVTPAASAGPLLETVTE